MSFFNSNLIGKKFATAAIMGTMLFGTVGTLATYAPSVEAQSIERVRSNDQYPTVGQEVRLTIDTSGYRNAAVGLEVKKPGDTEFTEVQALTFAYGARGTTRSIRFTPDRVGTYVLKINASEGGRRHTINVQSTTMRLMVNDGRRAGQRRMTAGKIQLSNYAGTSTTLSLNARGGSSALVYQFEYKALGSNRGYTTLQHHATNNRVQFSPTGFGIYEVKGWVKESSANGGPSSRSLFFHSNTRGPRNVQISIPNTRRAETPFTVSASSDSQASYRFFMVSPHSPTVIVWLDNTPGNTARFNVPYAGEWLIGVEARSGRNKSYAVQKVTVGQKIKIHKLDPKDPNRFKTIKIKKPVINLNK